MELHSEKMQSHKLIEAVPNAQESGHTKQMEGSDDRKGLITLLDGAPG